MRSIVERYLEISNEVKLLILSELFLHIINAAFFLILLIFMDKMGYPDHEAAGFISYRFLGVIAFALPLGLYIKGRKLRPLILASGIAVPVFSILIVYAIQFHYNTLLHISLFFWGKQKGNWDVMFLVQALQPVDIELNKVVGVKQQNPGIKMLPCFPYSATGIPFDWTMRIENLNAK